jgi:hypothetical protein
MVLKFKHSQWLFFNRSRFSLFPKANTDQVSKGLHVKKNLYIGKAWQCLLGAEVEPYPMQGFHRPKAKNQFYTCYDRVCFDVKKYSM